MMELGKRLTGGRGSLWWQYAAATVVFTVLVLAIIFLFGHLISQSLSKNYLEDVLISGREEARKIAELISDGQSEATFDVLEKRRAVLIRTLEGLPQRQIWETVEVVDRDGRVVYTSHFQSTEEIPDEQISPLELSGAHADQEVHEEEIPYRVSVPLGEVGEVVLSANRGRLAERVTRLRSELLKQTVVVAAVTLLTLSVAFLVVWVMIQRTRRLENKSREAEELATLGVLAANLAHEIRNPLNSINLNLELLEEDLDAGVDEAAESVVATRREVGRLAGLVNDFLTYARPTDPCFKVIKTADLLTEVRDFLQAEAHEMGVHLRIGAESRNVEIRGDSGQLKQVLLNLVINAVQAVAEQPADRRLVQLSADNGSQDEDEVVFVVRDRGDGIPEEEFEKAFKAFYTLRRGGTGLGLAIAKRIVEAHDGRIEFENLEDSGFVVRVVLPSNRDDGKMSR